MLTPRLIWVMLLAVAEGAALSVVNGEARLYLVAAIILTLFIAFFAALRQRSPVDFSPLDLGIVFAGIIAAYSVLPLFAFALSGWEFGALDDSRLGVIDVSAERVEHVGLLYAALLASFCSAYYLMSSSHSARPRAESLDGSGVVIWIAVAYITAAALPALARIAFGISEAGSYGGTYTQFQHLPLLVQQVLHHSYGLAIALKIMLVLALMHAFRQQGLWLIGGWVFIEVLVLAGRPGARTDLFVLLVAAAFGYHHLVRPITLRLSALLAALAVCLFLALGALREVVGTQTDGIAAGLLTRNEFVSLFINALDILHLVEEWTVDELSAQLMFADLARPIPQQLLWFEKIAPAEWYVNSYYPEYAEEGGGLAFGIAAEALVGFGAIDIVLRGLILGLVFGTIRAWVADGTTVWKLSCYVWLVVNCYHSVRNSTFAPATLFLYDFLPVLVLFRYLNGKRKGSRPAAQAGHRAPVLDDDKAVE